MIILTFNCLQNHENVQIYNRAVKILETYFGAEEEVQGNDMNPAIAESGNQFTFGGGMGGPPGGQGGPAAGATFGAPGQQGGAGGGGAYRFG